MLVLFLTLYNKVSLGINSLFYQHEIFSSSNLNFEIRTKNVRNKIYILFLLDF